MATGKCSIGDVVEAAGSKVLENDVLMAVFGDGWHVSVVHSVVCAKGSRRKWKVGWDLHLFSVVREHRSL